MSTDTASDRIAELIAGQLFNLGNEAGMTNWIVSVEAERNTVTLSLTTGEFLITVSRILTLPRQTYSLPE